MLPEFRRYLDEVKMHLHLEPELERQVLSEIYSHFQEKLVELGRSGIVGKRAARMAVRSLYIRV